MNIQIRILVTRKRQEEALKAENRNRKSMKPGML